MFKLENPSLYVVCKPCISPLLIINVLFQNSVCFILLLKMILESKITTLWCSKYHHLPIYLEVISPLNNHQVSHQYRILKPLIHRLTPLLHHLLFWHYRHNGTQTLALLLTTVLTTISKALIMQSFWLFQWHCLGVVRGGWEGLWLGVMLLQSPLDNPSLAPHTK